MNTRPQSRVFKHLPRDPANVNAMEQTCDHYSCILPDSNLNLNQKHRKNIKNNCILYAGSLCTPQPLYNMVHYNTVLDITQLSVGPQLGVRDSFSYITYTFYSQYSIVRIAITDVDLDPKNSVIKRFSGVQNRVSLQNRTSKTLFPLTTLSSTKA